MIFHVNKLSHVPGIFIFIDVPAIQAREKRIRKGKNGIEKSECENCNIYSLGKHIKHFHAASLRVVGRLRWVRWARAHSSCHLRWLIMEIISLNVVVLFSSAVAPSPVELVNMPSRHTHIFPPNQPYIYPKYYDYVIWCARVREKKITSMCIWRNSKMYSAHFPV